MIDTWYMVLDKFEMRISKYETNSNYQMFKTCKTGNEI